MPLHAHLSRTLFLFALPLALTSCTDDLSDVRSTVRRADAEVAAHYEAVARADSLAEALDEVDRHSIIIDDELRDVRIDLEDSEPFCDDDDLDRVWDLVRQVDRRIDDYLADANLSRQLDALIAAAADYDADMERLLDDVRDEVDGVDCL